MWCTLVERLISCCCCQNERNDPRIKEIEDQRHTLANLEEKVIAAYKRARAARRLKDPRMRWITSDDIEPQQRLLYGILGTHGEEPAELKLRRKIRSALDTMCNCCEGAVRSNCVHENSTLVLTYKLSSPAEQPLIDELNKQLKMCFEVSEDRLSIVFSFPDRENLGVQNVEDLLARLGKSGYCSDEQRRISPGWFDNFHKSSEQLAKHQSLDQKGARDKVNKELYDLFLSFFPAFMKSPKGTSADLGKDKPAYDHLKLLLKYGVQKGTVFKYWLGKQLVGMIKPTQDNFKFKPFMKHAKVSSALSPTLSLCLSLSLSTLNTCCMSRWNDF